VPGDVGGTGPGTPAGASSGRDRLRRRRRGPGCQRPRHPCGDGAPQLRRVDRPAHRGELGGGPLEAGTRRHPAHLGLSLPGLKTGNGWGTVSPRV